MYHQVCSCKRRYLRGVFFRVMCYYVIITRIIVCSCAMHCGGEVSFISVTVVRSRDFVESATVRIYRAWSKEKTRATMLVSSLPADPKKIRKIVIV